MKDIGRSARVPGCVGNTVRRCNVITGDKCHPLMSEVMRELS